MDFLIWHYTIGLQQYIRRWFYAIGWVVHYFSLPLLPLSLFAPYKRLVDTENIVGFNLDAIFRQLTFNIISRCIGAIVRTTLFLTGCFLLLPTFFIGLIGLASWIVVPIIGIPYFLLSDPGQSRYLSRLENILIKDPSSSLNNLLSSIPGKFLQNHLGLTATELPADDAKIDYPALDNTSPVTFGRMIDYFVKTDVWDKHLLRTKGIQISDLQLAAYWWDTKYHSGQVPDPSIHYSRPGIGLELLFGYTPVLDKYSQDLGITKPFSHHLIGRQEIVGRIERSLSSGKCVFLVGQPGVGKKTVVLEFARRAVSGELGNSMSYKRVLELDYNFLLSQSLDLNQKKSSLSQILSEATYAGNIILVVKDLYRLTNPESEGLDFTDMFETALESRKLKIIVISSRTDYDRFQASNSRLHKYFDLIEAVPPSKEQAMDILLDFASSWEQQKHITVLVQSLRTIIDGCDKYISDTPFPEKALEILDNAIAYAQKENLSVITPDIINTVISEATGISLARLTQEEKKLLANLEDVLHQSLIGQETAITAVSKSLRARSVGAKSEGRPLGSFLFLGPTGVGKTETAKALSRVYYGSESSILRFDMAEYQGEEGLSRLIGSINKNLPGRLTTEIKNKPASMLLLDEIEKSPPEIYNLFLSLLDEGVITDAFGTKINCRHLFVIATSNAAASYVRQLVQQNTPSDQLQSLVLDYVQKEGLFSPELLNRFDGVIVFEPLRVEQLQKIAQLMLKDLTKNLDQRGINIEFSPEVFAKLSQEGYDPQFGARPMRRLIDITLGDILGKAILSEKLNTGNTARLEVENGEYSLKITS